jgi:hypothetical protein
MINIRKDKGKRKEEKDRKRIKFALIAENDLLNIFLDTEEKEL